MKNFRNNWLTEKTQTLEFKDPSSDAVVQTKWKDKISIYQAEQANIIKKTQINHQNLYPSNFIQTKSAISFQYF